MAATTGVPLFPSGEKLSPVKFMLAAAGGGLLVAYSSRATLVVCFQMCLLPHLII